MTVFEKMLTHLLLITNPSLRALALCEPLDSSWSGGGGGGATVLEAQAYCVPLSTGWGLKPPFYFLQTLSPYFFIQPQWTEKAKILASNTCMLFLSDPPYILLSIYTPNRAGGFPSLHTLSSLYSFRCLEVANLMNVSAYSMDFWFAFLESLVMLSIFSCAYLLSVGFPQRNNHFDPWPIFFFLGLYVFLILSSMSCLYVLKMNSLWVSSFENISSYSEGCLCLSLRVSFWYAKAFKFNSVPFSDLWFIFHFSKRQIHKELAAFMSNCVLFMFFSRIS